MMEIDKKIVCDRKLKKCFVQIKHEWIEIVVGEFQQIKHPPNGRFIVERFREDFTRDKTFATEVPVTQFILILEINIIHINHPYAQWLEIKVLASSGIFFLYTANGYNAEMEMERNFQK